MSALAVLFILAFIVSVDLRIIAVVGPDHDPSAAYASIDAVGGVGPIHVAAKARDLTTGSPPRRSSSAIRRARAGDHGAAAMDGPLRLDRVRIHRTVLDARGILGAAARQLRGYGHEPRELEYADKRWWCPDTPKRPRDIPRATSGHRATQGQYAA
jgi:hypothetical protein